ncbi:MAG: MBL fold metallo-hydrolase [Acidobacteriota bacterium]
MPGLDREPFELGPFRVRHVTDGGFRLDGGAMFGVVPKTLWERRKPADDRNRIRMATNCLLIEHGDDLVLVDTGIGDKHDSKFRDIFGLEAGARRLPEQLRDAGFELEDVSHVVLTHLHFDHAGWNASESADGTLAPTFPNARYWLSRGEVEHARSPNARDRASYDPRNWEPLFEAGVVELFDGDAEPLPGVRVIEVPGHNDNMAIVRVDGGRDDAQLVHWADLVPTTAHVPFPWIMGYDLYPLRTLAHKESWIPQAADGDWLCFFEHDADTPWARIRQDDRGRYRAEAVDS